MSVLTARGRTLEDLAFAQGRATADASGDRLLEDLAHVEAATGTPWDDFWRRTLLVRTARRSFERLDDATAAFVGAYSAGVRTRVPTWEPWTPLAVLAVHHVLFGSLGHHLWRRHVARVLGPDGVRALAQEVPALSGSNAWVAGGGRTASGRPLIGADPHRVVSVPGVYQRVHLVATGDDVDVLGLTFPGVPGVQHFGHTGSVAWAITNAMADTQDLVDVEASDVVEEVDGVPVTAHGPVVLPRGDDGAGLALRTVPWTTDDLGLGAVLPLLRARTVADVDAALDRWVDPVNEVLVADADGAVLHRVAGRVPWRERDDDGAWVRGAWSGWSVPHRRDVGPDETVVVANQRQGRRSDPLADELAPPHRARRLEQLLADRHDLGPGDVALHADTLLLVAPAWQERLGRIAASGPAAGVRDRLLAWDGRMDAASVDAMLFAAVRSATVRHLVADPALAPLKEPSADPWTGPADLFAPWLRPEPRVALALDRWLEQDEVPLGVDLDAALLAALEESAPMLQVPARWGSVHTFTPLDGPTIHLAGDEGCVWSTSSVPGVDDRVWRGPVARLVWCLADRSRSRWTVPDEVEVWAAGGASSVSAGGPEESHGGVA